MVERAEAAPYLNYPASPWWYFPAVGLWVAAMIGVFTWWQSNIILFVGLIAALLALEVVFLSWMQRRHGALPMPGRGTPPAEIASAWRRYFSSLPALIAVVALAWWQLGIPAASAVAFVLVTTGLAVYERSYGRAATKARERLG